MSEVHYKTHGPLYATPPDAEIYVKRVADDQACICMQRMEYITLIEPRQQGKTSLTYRLISLFKPLHYVFAWIDLSTMDKSNEVLWYKSIYTWVLRNLRQNSFILDDKDATPPLNGYTWLTFLTDIAEIAERVNVRIVFVLDEVGTTPPAWSTDFFSAIRSVYIQRANLPCLHHLNFIIAGAFNPRTLINDPNVSNFNVDQRIALPDFTREEVCILVDRLGVSARKTALLAKHIYYWTSGQPHLTQLLCKELAAQTMVRRLLDISEVVHQAVQRFLRTDRQHLAHIRDALKRETAFTQQYIRRIWHRSKPVPAFVPAENHIQAQLALIGIVKEAADGSCVIRNRLYEHILEGLWPDSGSRELQSDFVGERPPTAIEIFFSYAREDEALLKKLKSHLGVLKHQGIVADWYDREISAGSEWDAEIMTHLNRAHIVLLLLSATFISSDYCYSNEMKHALDRHTCGDAYVVPVVLRPVNWQNAVLGKLKALPAAGQAITTWRNQDEAFSQVVIEIRRVIEELQRSS